MRKSDFLDRILTGPRTPVQEEAEAFAPSNIALCKYWGKRDAELNLPLTSSLSVSLGQLGTHTRLRVSAKPEDEIWLNGERLARDSAFAVKLIDYLNLFRAPGSPRLVIETRNSIPTAAGLASSASGFAAAIRAIDRLYGFGLTPEQLSACARLGSGSACRSIFEGFVEWEAGVREDGADSIARPLPRRWPELRIGLVTVTRKEKAVGSRLGMKQTVETSHLYQSWPLQVATDLEKIRTAIEEKNFDLLGQTAEQNALSMHATMISGWPPLLYWQPESVAAMQRVWQLRSVGVAVYFTMDAGPNLKLLFQVQDLDAVLAAFEGVQVVAPFAG